jgi:hypothetical protein
LLKLRAELAVFFLGCNQCRVTTWSDEKQSECNGCCCDPQAIQQPDKRTRMSHCGSCTSGFMSPER